MLKIGSHAPDFTITLGSGERFTLSDNRGSNVVLFFFIRAFTHG
ncbi:MAG: redoxin domain-containing protein [Dehalococcoidia bacterium]|nr:redoxin domain-containing protein [Dehalococcoidia bacterium]